MCQNMERENSHLCRHTPAQCVRSHKHTQTHRCTDTCSPPVSPLQGCLRSTTSAQEKLVGEISLSSLRRENKKYYKFTSAGFFIKV